MYHKWTEMDNIGVAYFLFLFPSGAEDGNMAAVLLSVVVATSNGQAGEKSGEKPKERLLRYPGRQDIRTQGVN